MHNPVGKGILWPFHFCLDHWIDSASKKKGSVVNVFSEKPIGIAFYSWFELNLDSAPKNKVNIILDFWIFHALESFVLYSFERPIYIIKSQDFVKNDRIFLWNSILLMAWPLNWFRIKKEYKNSIFQKVLFWRSYTHDSTSSSHS